MMVILFMLTFMIVVAAFMTIKGYPLQETGRTLLTGAVSSLLGILYGYLKAGTAEKKASANEKPE